MACECDCMMLKTIQRLIRRQRILEERLLNIETELEEACE